MRGLVGVLGGMGPLATVDFFRKVVAETPAVNDQEHIPLIIDSVPSIPCRVAAILRDGLSPLPPMVEGLARLERAGAECLVIACNTAHFWYDELQRSASVPILHIVDAVAAELDGGRPGAVLGLMGTEATLEAKIYQKRLSARGIEFMVHTPEERAELVLPAIALVKQGRPDLAGKMIDQALQLLEARGADRCILACTELPVAVDASDSPYRGQCIDATRALARAAVRWSMAQRR